MQPYIDFENLKFSKEFYEDYKDLKSNFNGLIFSNNRLKKMKTLTCNYEKIPQHLVEEYKTIKDNAYNEDKIAYGHYRSLCLMSLDLLDEKSHECAAYNINFESFCGTEVVDYYKQVNYELFGLVETLSSPFITPWLTPFANLENMLEKKNEFN